MSDDESKDESSASDIDKLLSSLPSAGKPLSKQSSVESSEGGAESPALFKQPAKAWNEPEIGGVAMEEGSAKCCSFCKKTFTETDTYVAGKTGALICSDCILLCSGLLDDDGKDDS